MIYVCGMMSYFFVYSFEIRTLFFNTAAKRLAESAIANHDSFFV